MGKGEDWNAKKKNASINDDDDDEENDAYTDMDSIYEAPEKLILLSWMENIGRRLDSDKMPSVAQELWKDLLENPTSELKNLFLTTILRTATLLVLHVVLLVKTLSCLNLSRILAREAALFLPNSIAYIDTSLPTKRGI